MTQIQLNANFFLNILLKVEIKHYLGNKKKKKKKKITEIRNSLT